MSSAGSPPDRVNCARAGVEAALLRVIGMCQVVLVDVAPGTFGVSGRLTAGLENCLKRLLCTSATRAAVCSSVRRERSVFPLTVMTPQGPGILSLSYA